MTQNQTRTGNRTDAITDLVARAPIDRRLAEILTPWSRAWDSISSASG
jgi:hypothetical protein